MKPTLTVTSRTTAQDLRTLLDDAADQGATKLRAKTKKDGSVVLYARQGGTTLGDRLFGNPAKKREMAGQVVRDILQRTPRLEASALTPLQHTLANRGTQNLRTQTLEMLLNYTELKQVTTQDIGRLPVSVQDQVNTAIDRFASDAATLPRGDQAAKATLEAQFVNDLKAALTGPDMTLEMREHLATSDGTPFVSELLDRMQEGGALPRSYARGGNFTAMATRVFNEIASDLTGNQVIDDQTIDVGGETFTKAKKLGAGGYGEVFLYRSASGAELAMKTATGSAGFADYAHEARTHRSYLEQADPDFCLGLEGVIRTPEGELAILTPIANQGDFAGMIARLDDEAAKPDSPFTAQELSDMRITLFQDMLASLQEMRDAGFTHADVKQQNFFVHDGGLMIADLGLSMRSDTFAPSYNRVPNPVWLSPERVSAQEKNADISNTQGFKNTPEYKAFVSEVRAGLQDNFGVAVYKDLHGKTKEVFNTIFDTRRDDLNAQVAAQNGALATIEGSTSDVWGAGITILQSLIGDKYNNFESFWQERTITLLKNFMEQPAGTDPLGPQGIIVEPHQPNDANSPNKDDAGYGFHHDSNGDKVMNQSRTVTTGDDGIDDLLRSMLGNRAENRPSPSALLNHAIFSRENVGTPETRQRLMDLTA